MKKYFKILISFCFLTFSLCGHEKFGGNSLLIENNSDERIYFWHSDDYTVHHFPDISLPATMPLYVNSAAAHSGAGSGWNNPDWNSIYAQLPEEKFTIYFFDKLATTQEEWDDIRINHMVLRKDVTLQELKEKNYTIYYP